ncbi:hypothetical protein SAMN05421810_11511 [Amycolatopsis arida]|uniref:Uncharacterized protein n=1 Tax=Amycolatopsis arida TaxID=587909 RepID=A0A1I6AVR0_9PSEU|nr:hypothetical protein [Amycolatopsis arida]TDX85407.1 hypothetical protein CLV69_11566 [Amycolatopsis arida]SFQ72772.1 hypothetical protein SAMN05421810_11511 [Amycolatopsis arida]
MTVLSGTTRARSEHTVPWAALGLMLAMAPPVALIVFGIAAEGWAAISWVGAIVWGVVASLAFTVFSIMGRAMGMTRMDLLDLLGSTVARPGSGAARALGLAIHLTNGAVLAVAWAYGTALFGLPANWVTALGWAVVLTALALLMMSMIGGVHPAMRRGEQDDPGPAAINFGRMTPMGSLVGHLVYGLVLGLTYSAWPLT